ncbi:MAG: hypothetical protein H6873_01975 [Hyphomicrobiaceae bacterium]|nr:hypothetical protein [Hyphomicrobiaceae bacterium]
MHPFRSSAISLALSRFTLVGTALLILALGVTSAMAQSIDSAYTSINLDECQTVPPSAFGDTSEDSAYWACVGYNNSLVLVSEGDLRMFVSYGDSAINETAWHQTLPAFNELNDTLEWRLKKVDGNWVPFATIVRYFTDAGDGSEKGEILVVTRLEPGNTCHVAYVDAKLTPDANVVARQFADQFAPTFNCVVDEIHTVPS